MEGANNQEPVCFRGGLRKNSAPALVYSYHFEQNRHVKILDMLPQTSDELICFWPPWCPSSTTHQDFPHSPPLSQPAIDQWDKSPLIPESGPVPCEWFNFPRIVSKQGLDMFQAPVSLFFGVTIPGFTPFSTVKRSLRGGSVGTIWKHVIPYSTLQPGKISVLKWTKQRDMCSRAPLFLLILDNDDHCILIKNR